MTWILCTSGSAISKAGLHADSSIITSGSVLLKFATESEGSICADCHTDFITNYSGLPTGIKNALADVCSSKVAMKIVGYNPTGYITREMDVILNINDDIIRSGIATLKDKTNQRFST